MKVKTLLKTLDNIDYVLLSTTGNLLYEGFRSNWDYKNNVIDCDIEYLDYKVLRLSTIKDNDKLFIYISNF